MAFVFFEAGTNAIKEDSPEICAALAGLYHGVEPTFDERPPELQNALILAAGLFHTPSPVDVNVRKIGQGGAHDIFLLSDPLQAKQSLIARVAKESRQTARVHLSAEAAVLDLVVSRTTVPVPRVLHLDAGGEGARPWMLMERCEGVTALWIRDGASEAAKAGVIRSSARMTAELYKLSPHLPRGFGSLQVNRLVSWTAGAEHAPRLFVGPLRDVELGDPWEGPFTDARSLFRTLVSSRKAALRRASISLEPRVFSAMLSLSEVLLALLPKSQDFHRPVLVHLDPRPGNLISNPATGETAAVIDWEWQAVMPAFLGVQHPTWLSFEGYFKPSKWLSTRFVWETRHDDALGWKRVFEKELESLSPEAVAVVRHPVAQRLRELYEWLRNLSPRQVGECGDDVSELYVAWDEEVRRELASGVGHDGGRHQPHM